MTPSLDIPASVETARQRAVTGDAYAMWYLKLCAISYSVNPGTIPAQVAHMAPLPGLSGTWSTAWGPVLGLAKANLMYAVTFTEATSGAPVLCAVCIRGTDVQTTVLGDLLEVFENFGVMTQVDLANPPGTGARISLGSSIGHTILSTMSDGGRTILDFVTGLMKANPGLPVVVTGHSLGGCQTTVMAPHMAWALQQAGLSTDLLAAHNFAGPTAGDATFVGVYESCCGYARNWFNTLDTVPYFFWNIAGTENIYQPCGIADSAWMDEIIGRFSPELAAMYARTTRNVVMTGYRAPGVTDRTAETLWQHMPPDAYWQLVPRQPGVEPYPGDAVDPGVAVAV